MGHKKLVDWEPEWLAILCLWSRSRRWSIKSALVGIGFVLVVEAALLAIIYGIGWFVGSAS